MISFSILRLNFFLSYFVKKQPNLLLDIEILKFVQSKIAHYVLINIMFVANHFKPVRTETLLFFFYLTS